MYYKLLKDGRLQMQKTKPKVPNVVEETEDLAFQERLHRLTCSNGGIVDFVSYCGYDRGPKLDALITKMLEKEDPYVLVTHVKSGLGFTLTRSYAVLQPLVYPQVVRAFMNRPVDQTWDGWKTNCPNWAKALPKEEFYAVWWDPKE